MFFTIIRTCVSLGVQASPKPQTLNLEYCPHTVAVDNGATIQGLIYPTQLLLSGGSIQPKP